MMERGTSPAGEAAPRTVSTSPEARADRGNLYELRIADLWDVVRRQPLSFWFATAYLFVEYVRPQVVFPVLPDFPYGEVAIYASLTALALEGKLFRPWRAADTVLALFGGTVLLSSLFAYDPGLSWENFHVMGSWVLVYLLITSAVDSERRFLVYLLAYLLFSFKMSQHGFRSWAGAGFQFRGWGITGPGGWFHNSGEYAIQMVVFLAMSTYFVLGLRRHWGRLKTAFFALFPITALVSVAGSSSRGGQVAAGAALLWMVGQSRHRVRGFLVLGLVGLAGFLLLPEGQMERFEVVGTDETSEMRKTYWKDGWEIIQDHPLTGVGYNNWLEYYRSRRNPTGLEPHNVFIKAAAEMGFPGLLAFLLLILWTLRVNHRTRRLAERLGPDDGRFLHHTALGLDAAMVGYLTAGLFVTVLYYPFFWVNFAFTVALSRVTERKAKLRAAGRGEDPAPLRRTGT